jgi:hypothetical protein
LTSARGDGDALLLAAGDRLACDPVASFTPVLCREGRPGQGRAVRAAKSPHLPWQQAFREGFWGYEGFIAGWRYIPFMIMARATAVGSAR